MIILQWKWKYIPKILEKYPDLKKHLQKYDFDELKSEMEFSLDHFLLDRLLKTIDILENVLKDIREYETKKGFMPHNDTGIKNLPEYPANPADEEIDLGVLKLCILNEIVDYQLRFRKKIPGDKTSFIRYK